MTQLHIRTPRFKPVAAETFREWHNAVGLVAQKADLTPATPLVRFG